MNITTNKTYRWKGDGGKQLGYFHNHAALADLLVFKSSDHSDLVQSIYRGFRTTIADSKAVMKNSHVPELIVTDLMPIFKRIRIPQPELILIPWVERGLGLRRGLLPTRPLVTKEDVDRSDLETINRYEKIKHIDFKSIDLDCISAVITYLTEWIYEQPIGFSTIHDDIDSSIERIPRKTSSCYPKFKEKRTEEAISEAKSFISELKTIDGDPTIFKVYEKFRDRLVCVFHRITTKIKGNLKDNAIPDVKKRQIFGVPFSIILLEEMLFGNLIDQIMNKFPYFSSNLTREGISDRVRIVRDQLKREDTEVLCGDISQIDANISHWFICLAIDLCNLKVSNDSLNQMIVRGYKLWSIVTPVAGSFGFRYTMGGNITGSKLTVLINSIAVFTCIQVYALTKIGRLLTPDELQILGDDFIVALPFGSRLELTRLMVKFGLSLNVDKTLVTISYHDPISFLGFDWNYKNEPIASINWIVSRTCYPERFVPVDGRERIYQRFCSIVFQSANGMFYFKNILLKFDSYFKNEIYNKGIDPLIEYYDKFGGFYSFKIPLSLLLTEGWKSF